MMKVANLTGAELDRWVAKADGWELERKQDNQMRKKGVVHGAFYSGGYSHIIAAPFPKSGMVVGLRCHWSPSTMWGVGGPIMERERITVRPTGKEWAAFQDAYQPDIYGSTALEAAMRAFVASKFGDEVEE